jgi:hypothetical protein
VGKKKRERERETFSIPFQGGGCILQDPPELQYTYIPSGCTRNGEFIETYVVVLGKWPNSFRILHLSDVLGSVISDLTKSPESKLWDDKEPVSKLPKVDFELLEGIDLIPFAIVI